MHTQESLPEQVRHELEEVQQSGKLAPTMERCMRLSVNAVCVHPGTNCGDLLQDGPVLLVAVHQERSSVACVLQADQGLLIAFDVHAESARCKHIDDIDAEPTSLWVQV